MRTPDIRLLLLVDVLALASTTGGFLLAIGLPLAARGRLTPAVFMAVVVAGCILVVVCGTLLLSRTVERPVTRLLDTAARLDAARGGAELPWLGESGGLALARAALAFERVAAALDEEQHRLATKVVELSLANAQLADARELLLRSEKLATVGRLAAGIAHEVGNPLGSITGYTELARRHLPAHPDPELCESLDRVDAAAARIDRTVRDLLEFAKPTVMALAPIDLRAALDGAIRLASIQRRFRNVVLQAEIPEDATCVVADEHQLVQVLLNLMLNAGDAMRGSGTVYLDARRDGDWISVEIADEGSGISDADLARVFDPFFTTKQPGEGAGLGLAIVHRLMESFGGSIVAVGRGSAGGATFILQFRRGATAAGHDPRAPSAK